MSTTQDVAYHMGGVPVHGEFTTGHVFFVDSNRGNKKSNNGKKPSTAFATLDEATNACTANNHDIVYIMPNHAETISGATTWVPDVAGVQYIGIGMGADAPELTFSATTSTIPISGGNNLFKNIRFVAGISAVACACAVGADHVTFDDCTWDYSTTLFDFTMLLNITAFDYCTVQNCMFITEARTTGPVKAIGLDDAHHTTIRNNIFTGLFQNAVISNESTDAAMNHLMILDNVMYNDDTLSTNGGIRITSTSHGVISGNRIGWMGLATRLPVTIDPGECVIFDNYVSNAINAAGISTAIGPATT